MRLVLTVITFSLLGFLLSECANELSNVLYNDNQPDPNAAQSATSGLDGLKSSLLGDDNGRKSKNQTKSNALPHGPRKNDTDYHIPTYKIYKDYLRKANSVKTTSNNSTSNNSTSNNSTSNNSTSHGVSKNLLWKVPHGKNSTSKTSGKNDTSMPHVEKSNHTLVNISYVDFLLNFANLTVQYLPNVTVTNDSVKIHNTVYDRQLKNRTFKADYDKNEFMKDGQQFRYVSGEVHYFRSFPQTWRRKMRAMRAAGLGVISTYIEWGLHNPQDNEEYEWSGIKDAEKFIRMAIEEDLLVIFRPSPYICAERNGGGIPYWLVAKYPTILLRTMDPNYLKEVRKWYEKMMPMFIPYLYENGGPIIMVQVENEYGVRIDCSKDFRNWMRDETDKYVKDKAVLFTNDIKDEAYMKCGKIDNVLATTDFNVDSNDNIDKFLKYLRAVQPNGPCVNSEFYVGWGTYWFDKSERYTPEDQVVATLSHQLEKGCSVNIFMFHGGTNYEFSTSTGFDANGYEIGITSYDYDAPMTEAGDITPKYFSIKKVVNAYFPSADYDPPQNESKMVPPAIDLKPRTTLFSSWARFLLGSSARYANQTLFFENFNQDAGFLLYESQLDDSINNPEIKIPGLRDRALIYLNNTLVGTLSRKKGTLSTKIDTGKGKFLQILVENVGRKSYGVLMEWKGIYAGVTLNDKKVENWNITSFPFANMANLTHLLDTLQFVDQDADTLKRMDHTSGKLTNEPIIYEAQFNINGDVHDTYIDTRGWGKGFVVINGFNIGRYWPLAGPQMTLFLPKEIMKKENNSIIVFEMEQSNNNNKLNFIDKPMYMHVISEEI